MPEIQLLAMTCDIDLVASEGGSDKLPTFEMTAYTGGAMTPGGFMDPVVVNLAGLSVPSQKVPIRFNHDVGAGVGHTTEIVVEAGKLIARGVVSRDTEAAREVVVASKRGFPWQASIGASITKSTYVASGKFAEVNGRRFPGPVTVIEKASLREISVVESGADSKTKTQIAAQVGCGNTTDGENDMSKITADGGTKGTAAAVETASDKSTETKAIEASAAPKADNKDVLEAAAAQAKAIFSESNRVRDIGISAGLAKTNHYGAEKAIDLIAKAAVESGATVEEFDAQVDDLVASAMPNIGTPRRDSGLKGMTGEVIEAGLCVANGLPDAKDHFSEEVLASAEKSFGGSLGIKDATHLVARMNGKSRPSLLSDVTVDVLRAASPSGYSASNLEASAGTMSVPTILSNVANKFLRVQFMSVENAWREVSSVRSVRDFKQISTTALTGGFDFEQVGSDGELKSGTAGEVAYTNQADTFGKIFGLSRKDFINDDLGAFLGLARRIGRGGATAFNRLFWTKFLDNSTFFTSGRNNYFDGSSSVLSISSLTTAETLFLNQTDPDGQPMGMEPEILLVPSALRSVAREIHMSDEVRNTTASTKAGTTNVFKNKFRPVSSTYLSNATITNNSATAWYLLGNPNDTPVIEAVFLNGRQTPVVETAEADFNNLGIRMRGYFDFGVELQEYRGGVKSKGAA